MRSVLSVLFSVLSLAVLLVPAQGRAAEAFDWQNVKAKARGQTVYWNAWGGSETINDYIAWVGQQVKQRFGVTLRHVKLTDTADAVARVIAEKAAGKTADGSIDLIWINGENFASMKEKGLLFGPFAESLPNFKYVDVENKPTTRNDFTVPTDGLEAPWGMAQFLFMYDTAAIETPPRSIPALLEWARNNPGRFSYPQPPDFLGSTFLKQALIGLTEDRAALQRPVADDADFARVTAPLWPYLDALHPLMWRKGAVLPKNGPALKQLLGDGEVDIALSFHPADASNAIEKGELPDTVRTFVLEGGTIGNTHFVAIPFNARAKEGAMVVANFLMSPEAQARKQDARYWGDSTVLAMDKLPPDARALFEALPRGIATLSPAELGKVLPEPHPSWMTRLEAEWQRRYGQNG